MSNPSNFKFAKTDEWVSVEGNVATIGVSDYAQSQLSDIVYLEFLIKRFQSFKPIRRNLQDNLISVFT